MTQYIPIMKTKQGELRALEQLATIDKLQPLMVVHEAKSMDARLINSFNKAWPHPAPIYIDAGIYQTSGAIITFFNELAANTNFNLIPVTDPMRTPQYQQAAIDAMNSVGHGLCIRLPQMFFNLQNGAANLLTNFLNGYRLDAQHIDLIIDIGLISTSPNILLPWVQSIIQQLKQIGPWKRIVLAGTSFPQTLQVDANQLYGINRWDWDLWKMLVSSPGYNDINYADYTCLGIPYEAPFAMVAPKIRYAADGVWLYARGNGRQFQQYHDLARTIVSQPQFKGSTFSAGDNFIYTRAQQAHGIGSGNAASWVAADVNHHIAFVLSQI